MSSVERRQTAKLLFSPNILSRLGEELTPDADQGILELVRNAWDADSTVCKVELRRVGTTGQVVTQQLFSDDADAVELSAIEISDDGRGMTVDQIRAGWLLLGASGKESMRSTPSGRPVIGNKGLGRLAALRLGHKATLITRPAGAGQEHRVTLDWDKFDSAATVDAVPIPVETIATRAAPGTSVLIERLRRPMRRREAESLARELVLLADPFGDPSGFIPELDSAEFSDLATLVKKKGYFDAARFSLHATVAIDGKAIASLKDRSGRVVARSKSEDFPKRYGCPPADLDVWTFRLTSGDFAQDTFGLKDVRAWLHVVGGVHVYHRGLRVRPYGDPGNDWLDLNLSRARSPEEATSTNNTIGLLMVKDPDEVLVAKTDRLGFADTDAFSDLRRFAADSLQWMSRWRLEQAEARRKKRKLDDEAQLAKAKKDFEQSVSDALPKASEAEREKLSGAASKLQAASARREEGLASTLDLYRSLASVGAAYALFAHEWSKPAGQLEGMLNEIVDLGKWKFGLDFEDLVSEPFGHSQTIIEGLKSYTRLPLRLLEHERRRRKSFNAAEACKDVASLFDYPIARAQISLSLALEETNVFGVPAAFEVIIANLITNAISAVESQPLSKRQIRLSVENIGAACLVTVSDSGPGIQGIDVANIWTLGATTTEEGTGIGLTIVNDAVGDLGGRVGVESPGDLGGATFEVEIPLSRR